MSQRTLFILNLIMSFPVLRRRLQGRYGSEPFDPVEFKKMSEKFSTSEMLVAHFILYVWDSRWAEEHGCKFDISKVGMLEECNRAPLIAWIKKPRTASDYSG